jgi:hypothetical protein
MRSNLDPFYPRPLGVAGVARRIRAGSSVRERTPWLTRAEPGCSYQHSLLLVSSRSLTENSVLGRLYPQFVYAVIQVVVGLRYQRSIRSKHGPDVEFHPELTVVKSVATVHIVVTPLELSNL